MSRIGNVPIIVPDNVELNIDQSVVKVKGPKGSLFHKIPSSITVILNNSLLKVQRNDEERISRCLHGLTRTLINNLIIGVTQGYSKELEIVGTGYRVQQKGDNLELSLGYSHPVIVTPLPDVFISAESQTKIIVSGIDKQKVGEMAANIRKLRKPDPYKGKGIRYAGEIIRRKVGKSGT